MTTVVITSEAKVTKKGLSVSAHNGVLHLQLHRPERLNAFTAELITEVREYLAEARDDVTIRAIMFSGSGKAFSAGIALTSGNGDEKPGWFAKRMRATYHALMQEMVSYPKPVITAVHGVCVGGAMGFITSSDIVLCSHSARFILAFVKVGLVPDCGTSWGLPKRIGQARARAWALLGDEIDGATAANWGLVWKSIDEDKLMDETTAIAARLANGPAVAIQQIKDLFNASENASLSTAFDAEVEAQIAALAHPDAKEGRTAFLEGRAAKFGVNKSEK